MGHILQKCPMTHFPRIDRHDAVARLIHSFARRADPKVDVVQEPIIAPSGDELGHATKGSLKPDLVFHNKGVITVVDPTIVADNASLHDLRREADVKVQKYEVPAVRKWARRRFGVTEEVLDFEVIGLPMTWRGMVLSEHLNRVLMRLRCKPHLRILLPIRALTYGWKVWAFYSRKACTWKDLRR